MNSTRQIQHCGNTGTHSHNRSLAQNSNTNISGFQCNRIVCPHFNNTSSHLTSSSSEGIQFGFNHIQFGPIRNQPSRFFFRDQQLHTCTPEWEIAQTNQHNRTLQTRIHSHIQPPEATLRDHPPHPRFLPFQHLQNTLEPTNKYSKYHPNRAIALDFLRIQLCQ